MYVYGSFSKRERVHVQFTIERRLLIFMIVEIHKNKYASNKFGKVLFSSAS